MALGIVSRATARKNLVVNLAVGHGDFQDGNILIDTDNQLWIVDWEHSGRRQVVYDYLVFLLKSRFPHDLATRVRSAAENPVSVMQSLPIVPADMHRLVLDTHQWIAALVIFLLEELAWNLGENTNPLFRCQSGAWLSLRKEIKPALQYISATLDGMLIIRSYPGARSPQR
jgi:thiamine kinase-like enzyme